MNKFIALHLLLLCLGCGNEIIPSDLNLLNGYWNIDYISHKNETFNPKGAAKLFDYYEVNDRKGVRKKVQPSLNNKFLVTEDLNYFKVIFDHKSCYLNFKTTWDQWKEKIVLLTEDELILEHQEKRYHYKKFQIEDYP